jgi:imidazolonepropionase-like amidohydrolase
VSGRRAGAALAALVGLLAAAGPGGAAARAETLAVRGATVHTMVAGAEPIADGVVVVTDGKIAAVGPAAEVAIPEGARVLEAAVVTPGLIDARTSVGLTGILNQPHDQDQLERSEAIQPELRALDAYDAREPLIEWIRGFGVTTVHTGHAPGALVPGQTMIAKTRGDEVADAVVVPVAMIAASLGDGAVNEGDNAKPPGSRSKAVAMLRTQLVAARAYRDKAGAPDPDKRPDRDLRLETLARVLDGELPLLISAHRHQDIDAALRLAAEFGFRLVLEGGAEAYELIDQIRAAGVPVIVHPAMKRSVGEAENLSMATAGRLADAGIPIALESGFEGYVPKTRVVLFEAAVAAAHGLGPDRALAALTRDAAHLLAIDDRVGTLEPGKDGDLALYDGDPFEYTTHCTATVIEGEVVFEGAR